MPLTIPIENAPPLLKRAAGKNDYSVDFAEYLFVGDLLAITGASNAATLVITLKEPRGAAFSNGTAVQIRGVEGNTAANGLRYVKFVTSTTYELYSDVGLTTPVAGNGVYITATGELYESNRISSVVWTVPSDITKSNELNTATDAKVRLSGGTLGKSYEIKIHAVFTDGQEDDRFFSIVIGK